jgi:hypothetical protein
MIQPKQKAQDLHIKFFMSGDVTMEQANEIAIIAVDEIIEATVVYKSVREKVDYSGSGYDNVIRPFYERYWQDVKENLIIKKEMNNNIKKFVEKHK